MNHQLHFQNHFNPKSMSAEIEANKLEDAFAMENCNKCMLITCIFVPAKRFFLSLRSKMPTHSGHLNPPSPNQRRSFSPFEVFALSKSCASLTNGRTLGRCHEGLKMAAFTKKKCINTEVRKMDEHAFWWVL